MNNYLLSNTILKERYEIEKFMGTDGLINLYQGKDLQENKKIMVQELFWSNEMKRNEKGAAVIIEKEISKEYYKAVERAKKNVKHMESFQEEEAVFKVENSFIENNIFYIITEYVDVVSLKEYLKELKETKMDLQEVLDLLNPVMNLLERLHRNQMIHGEIVPLNIYINKDSKKTMVPSFFTVCEDDSEETIYSCGGYTAIEQQCRTDLKGAWTDVYSLCAIIYESITGRKIPSAIDRLMQDEIVSPELMNPCISKENSQVLLKGLAVKAEDRIQSVEELRKHLK